jgi:hypothetical protein
MRNMILHPITRAERDAASATLRRSAAGEEAVSPERLDLARWMVRNYFPICGHCGQTFSARHTCDLS